MESIEVHKQVVIIQIYHSAYNSFFLIWVEFNISLKTIMCLL